MDNKAPNREIVRVAYAALITHLDSTPWRKFRDDADALSVILRERFYPICRNLKDREALCIKFFIWQYRHIDTQGKKCDAILLRERTRSALVHIRSRNELNEDN